MGRATNARAHYTPKSKARSRLNNGLQPRRAGMAATTTSKTKKGQRIDFEVIELQRQYTLPLRKAAENLGVCEAVLKRICRRKEIAKWPYRHLKSIGKKMDEIKKQMRELNRNEHQTQYDAFVQEIKNLVAEREAFYDLEATKEDIDAALADIDNIKTKDLIIPKLSQKLPVVILEKDKENTILFDRTQVMPFNMNVDVDVDLNSSLTELENLSCNHTLSSSSPQTDETSSFAEEATRIFEDVTDMAYISDNPVDPFLKEFEMKYWNDNVEDTVLPYNLDLMVHPTSLSFFA